MILIRLLIEFVVAVWDHYLKVNIEILEKVQRRANKLD
jgi:hypothetical protein